MKSRLRLHVSLWSLGGLLLGSPALPGGTQVAAAADSRGLLTYMSFTASQSGTYQLRAGCYSSGSCGGTVAYSIQ
jgi:hypothetical protein